MSDLTLEDTVFESLKKTFSSISDRMEDARRSLRGADASAVGESKLVEDVQDFADEWGYGIKQLGKHTHGAVKMINTIGKTFGDLDLELAQSLKAKKKGK
ncbi:hypothetical protein ACWDLL_00305 [Streptomyces griseoincarnatus]|uniref:Uncharacterized protein n=1 Tax=Streptomyces labedae TaxID=285569 RepID=A0ABP6QVK6_9ACTN|nr:MULTISPECIES: hypothetical protein [unclassified Streptomyces]MCA2199894.1 hypothetical protein [Streptomyces sp. SMS_SU21]MDH3036772.1 hypothetical protein [Streptomyces sp. TRM75561]NEA93640.1 hypothetical protein [Actinospica acidiphila]